METSGDVWRSGVLVRVPKHAYLELTLHKSLPVCSAYVDAVEVSNTWYACLVFEGDEIYLEITFGIYLFHGYNVYWTPGNTI